MEFQYFAYSDLHFSGFCLHTHLLLTTSHPTTWRGGNLFHVMSSWAVLKSFFISQGHKELLTPPLTRHLRGHIASLHNGIPVFCLCRLTLLRVLRTHTFLWPPPILPHEGGLQRGSVDFQATVWEYWFAMCRNESKSIYQLGWFIKLRKHGALSTQNALSMCKSFSRHKCLFTSWTPAKSAATSLSQPEMCRGNKLVTWQI